MHRSKRITKLSLESERTYIFRNRDGVRRRWCPRCIVETEMVTVRGVSELTQLSELEIYRLIDSAAVHFAEDTEGRLWVCLSSLAESMIYKSKEK